MTLACSLSALRNCLPRMPSSPPSTYAVHIPKARAVDIDNPEDWELAEASYEVIRRREGSLAEVSHREAPAPAAKRAADGQLAIHGGTPVRTTLLPLPYGKQCIADEDVRVVVECLHADFLTTRPKVGRGRV